MDTTPQTSTVIGVFPTLDQAEKAIDELRRAQFSYDRIRLVERGTGNFLDPLKGMFTGQAAVTSNTAENLVKMGMPEYEAQHYQRELDTQHVLVMMNAGERPENALVIMRHNGAFDISARLRTAPAHDSAEADARRQAQEAPHPEAVAPSANAAASAPRSNVPPERYSSDRPQEPLRNP